MLCLCDACVVGDARLAFCVCEKETLSRARDHKDLWLVWFDSR